MPRKPSQKPEVTPTPQTQPQPSSKPQQKEQTAKPSKPKRKIVKRVQDAIDDAVAVTSPAKKLNFKDYVVSGIGSIGAVLLAGLVHAWSLLLHLLDVTADAAISYLRTIPKADRPSWLALLSFFAIGLLILNKRRSSNPTYSPQTTPTNLPPSGASPTVSPVPPPAAGPLPPGVQPQSQNSAF